MENNYFKGQVKVVWLSVYIVEICGLILLKYKEENQKNVSLTARIINLILFCFGRRVCKAIDSKIINNSMILENPKSALVI